MTSHSHRSPRTACGKHNGRNPPTGRRHREAPHSGTPGWGLFSLHVELARPVQGAAALTGPPSCHPLLSHSCHPPSSLCFGDLTPWVLWVKTVRRPPQPTAKREEEREKSKRADLGFHPAWGTAEPPPCPREATAPGRGQGKKTGASRLRRRPGKPGTETLGLVLSQGPKKTFPTSSKD